MLKLMLILDVCIFSILGGLAVSLGVIQNSFSILHEILPLIFGLIYILFMVLVLANFILIFFMWPKHRFKSLLPFGVVMVLLPLFIFVFRQGYSIGIRNTPLDPDSYLSEINKKELISIAETLLGDVNENSFEVLEQRARHKGLRIRDVDIPARVVMFGSYRPRTWFIYVYAENGLPLMYSTEPVITEYDIRSWGELVSIIKTENNPSKYDLDNIVFEPRIAYPFLAANLDSQLLAKLRDMPAGKSLGSFFKKDPNLSVGDAIRKRHLDYDAFISNQLTPKEKQEIIEVLNKQSHAPWLLLEDESIHFVKTSIRAKSGPNARRESRKIVNLDNFSKVRGHLPRLISKGLITVKDKEGHLSVKSDLTEGEQREIQWLNVEIMNFGYGNFLEKRQYSSNDKRKLSDKWYFYMD